MKIKLLKRREGGLSLLLKGIIPWFI